MITPPTMFDIIRDITPFSSWAILALLLYIWRNHLRSMERNLKRIEKLITDHIVWHSEEKP